VALIADALCDAVRAETAGKRSNLIAYFAKIFVAENLSLFDVSSAFIHVQIRDADVGGGELDDDIGTFFDLLVRNFVDGDLLGARDTPKLS
jgi:hypothetical protein